jgi:putative membrane protein
MHKILAALCIAIGSALGSFVLPAEAADRVPKVVSPAEFVTRAALFDMFETQSSELAAVKADKPTRAFAAMMNADHQKTSSQLGVIVKGHAKDLPLPPRLNPGVSHLLHIVL